MNIFRAHMHAFAYIHFERPLSNPSFGLCLSFHHTQYFTGGGQASWRAARFDPDKITLPPLIKQP
jgi:hypothetical protein